MGSLQELQKQAGIPGRLLNLGFGAYLGSNLGQSIADILHGGPIGLAGSETLQNELRENVRRQAGSKELREAQKAMSRSGVLGGIIGGTVSLPLALLTKKPLIPLAAVLLGRKVGRDITKRLHPLADPQLPALDLLFSKYRGLLSHDEANLWHAMMNSDILKQNPQIKNKIINTFIEKARQTPEFRSYEKAQRLGKILGAAGGAAAMLGGMRFGKKSPISELKPGWITGSKFPALKHMFGGSTYWPWLGLAGASTATGVLGELIGGKRGNLPKREIRRRAIDSALNNLGFNVLFYGGLAKPSSPGSW